MKGLPRCNVVYEYMYVFIHSFIHAFIYSEVCFKQVLSLLKCQSSTKNELVLPISIHITFHFPQDHPVDAYVLFLVYVV